MGNKYSPEQLREKARIALAARDAGDVRWSALLMMCATMSGLPLADVVARIEAFAK